MKNISFFFLIGIVSSSYAQTTTDSISTLLGEFVLITTEETEESTGYMEESFTTSDGGTVEFVAINSGARFAAPANVSQTMAVKISPNPSADVVQLEISSVEGQVSIVVTDVLGQVVYSSNLNVDKSRTTYLPSQLWASGTYLIVVSAGGEVTTERLVIE